MRDKEMSEQVRKDILGIPLDVLASEFQRGGFENYRTKQVYQWIYQRCIESFDEMHNVPKGLKEWLEENYSLIPLGVKDVQSASDGTRKFLFHLADGLSIEGVLMPTDPQWSLCVSSQVGCALDCQFCATGMMGFQRNLTVAEILAQVLFAKRLLIKENNQILTHVVFMGMGEPLLNVSNVLQALRLITAPNAIAISPRRITVSTVGIVPGILKIAESELNVSLAISLNAPTQSLREELMPIAKKYPLPELIQTCRDFPLPQRRRITFEYVLLDGINNTDQHARQLIQLLRGLRCKVNLIPFNEFPGLSYRRPSEESIEQFGKIVRDAKYTVTVRRSKGRDIQGACGQLAAKGL